MENPSKVRLSELREARRRILPPRQGISFQKAGNRAAAEQSRSFSNQTSPKLVLNSPRLIRFSSRVRPKCAKGRRTLRLRQRRVSPPCSRIYIVPSSIWSAASTTSKLLRSHLPSISGWILLRKYRLPGSLPQYMSAADRVRRQNLISTQGVEMKGSVSQMEGR